MDIALNTVDVAALFGETDNNDLGTSGTGADDRIELDNDGTPVRGAITITNTSTSAEYRSLIGFVDTAISTMNGALNSIGINQRSLSGKEINLTEAITANSAAKSRIMDTDFAKEQSNSIRLQILQQTATAALSQANMGPQAVLGFLG
jgi:flagellin